MRRSLWGVRYFARIILEQCTLSDGEGPAIGLWLCPVWTIPPGHAIAVFPLAGISVIAILSGGYRLVPGAALGSCIFNLWIGYKPSLNIMADK